MNRIEKTIFLRASPDRVWAYLTEPALLKRWFHESDQTLTDGEDYNLLGKDGNRICWGRVEEAIAPGRLVYTFTHDHLQGHLTRVQWTVEAFGGGTRLHLVHDGFEGGPADPFEMIVDHDYGWDEHFLTLRKIAKDDSSTA